MSLFGTWRFSSSCTLWSNIFPPFVSLFLSHISSECSLPRLYFPQVSIQTVSDQRNLSSLLILTDRNTFILYSFIFYFYSLVFIIIHINLFIAYLNINAIKQRLGFLLYYCIRSTQHVTGSEALSINKSVNANHLVTLRQNQQIPRLCRMLLESVCFMQKWLCFVAVDVILVNVAYLLNKIRKYWKNNRKLSHIWVWESPCKIWWLKSFASRGGEYGFHAYIMHRSKYIECLPVRKVYQFFESPAIQRQSTIKHRL